MAPAARQHRKQNRWGLRFAFALASLLLILSLLWSVRLNVILARERARLSEYAGLVDQQEVVLEVVDAEDAVRRMLLPVEEYPTRPYGKIFSRSDMNHVVAMAARLPAVPAGEAYHLWVTQGGRMELAGLLNVNDDGFGLLVFDEDVNGPLYDSAQLTLQRLGEDAPSTAPILRWDATP